MQSQDVFQTGDVIQNEFQELTVVGFGRDDETVKVENMLGEVERKTCRELIEVTQKEA